MIRYNYNAQVQPPAPFVYVTLQNPTDGRLLRDQPAQIDPAADRTVLPDLTVGALGLIQVGSASFGGLGGVVHLLPIYAVLLGVHDLPPSPLRVLACDEPWVLLGRDVLNSHRLMLDGPGLVLEID